MTVQSNVRYTIAQYLENERAATEKSEYFNGDVSMMAGASRIKENLSGEVGFFLKGKSCQSFSRDMRLYIPGNSLFTYPDLMVICGEVALLDAEEDTALNPTLLAEVLFKSTASYDRGEKFELYRQIPSFREYLLLDARRVKAEVWRKNDLDLWTLTQETTHLTDTLHLASMGLHLPLTDAYAGTTFVGN